MMEPGPSGWIASKLGTCCNIVSGGTPRREIPEYWGGSIPWVTPKDISDLDCPDFYEPPEKITEIGLRNSSASLLPAGAVLLSSRAPIGLLAIAGKPMATNQGFKSLVPGPELDGRFLYYAVKRLVPLIQERGNGATFKEVSKAVVSEIPISYPRSLEEQRRIASILDKAEEIHRKHQRLNDLGGQLLMSTFLKTFGDPVLNPKAWEIEELGSVCSKITDGTHHTPPRQDQGILFITGKNIKPFRIDLEDIEYVSKTVHDEIYRRCNPEYGDVLYTNIGANTGTAAFNEFGFEFSMKNVALLKPQKGRVTGRFLEFLLNHPGFKNYVLSKLGQGGAQGFLGLKSIKSICIPVPAFDLQRDFERLVEKVRSSNRKLIQQGTGAHHLYSSISYRAFRGAL